MFMNAAELHETWIDLPRGAPITVGNFGDQILLEPSYRLLNGQLVDLGRADARIDRPSHQDHAAGLRRIAVFRVDASYVCNRANALFSARTARTGRPASRIARELCEATPLKGCRRRPCGWCPADGDADRLEVTEWPRHHREHDGNAALCSRR
jgi:hypothetical protein